MGPTILIQPSVLRKIFAEAGKKLEDYVDMVRLDPQWRCFFEDGAMIDLLDDDGAMAADLEARWPGMGAKYAQLMELSQELHSISDKFFFWKSVGSMKDTLGCGRSVRPEGAEGRDEDAAGEDGRGDDPRVYPGPEHGADAGPHGAVCGVVAGCVARDPDGDRAHADAGRHLVSDGRNARRAGGAGEAGDASSA